MPRYRCKIVNRTFSLLPEGLLPYYGHRTCFVLLWLRALCVVKVTLSALARKARVARTTLRDLKARFLGVVSRLRLPSCEGALGAAAFLEELAKMDPLALVDLFRTWKEWEPKHSVAGIYPRGAHVQ